MTTEKDTEQSKGAEEKLAGMGCRGMIMRFQADVGVWWDIMQGKIGDISGLRPLFGRRPVRFAHQDKNCNGYPGFPSVWLLPGAIGFLQCRG